MKTLVSVGLVLSTLLVTATALAQDKAACVNAAAKGQKLRNAHQLVEARDQLRICAAAGCPSVVQSDCVTWLADVEKSIPGVVVTAKNAAGADLIFVKVTVDGQPLLSKLTGQATEMDAGPHLFHFESADATLDQQVLVREGVKDQPVSVVLTPAGAAPAVVPAPAPVSPAVAAEASPSPPATPPAVPPEAPPPASPSSPLRTVGWVVGGVGAAGLVVGVVSGIIAVSDKSAANCTGDVCQGSVSGVKSAALASTVGFVAGGALLAGGVGLIVFAPRSSSAPTTTGVRVLPMVMANGGQLVAAGSF